MNLQTLRPLLAGMSDIARLTTLAMFSEHVDQAIARNVARSSMLRRMSALAVDGKVDLLVWSRDCDNCEGTSRHSVEITKFDEWCERQAHWAEGPWHIVDVLPIWAKVDLPPSRDRNMEAFENGHPWTV